VLVFFINKFICIFTYRALKKKLMGIPKNRMPKPKPSGVGFYHIGAPTWVHLVGPSLPYQNKTPKQNPRFLNFLNISNNPMGLLKAQPLSTI
jgi:hypothetical protein